MRFQATVTLDFKATSIAEAAEKLDQLLRQADGMDVADVQLGTTPRNHMVTLPAPPLPASGPPQPPRYSPPTAQRGVAGAI